MDGKSRVWERLLWKKLVFRDGVRDSPYFLMKHLGSVMCGLNMLWAKHMDLIFHLRLGSKPKGDSRIECKRRFYICFRITQFKKCFRIEGLLENDFSLTNIASWFIVALVLYIDSICLGIVVYTLYCNFPISAQIADTHSPLKRQFQEKVCWEDFSNRVYYYL